jgi:hypothetical protein
MDDSIVNATSVETETNRIGDAWGCTARCGPMNLKKFAWRP